MLVQPLSMMIERQRRLMLDGIEQPGIPAWKKVESPIVAITGVLTPRST